METNQPIRWRLGVMMVCLLRLLSSGSCDRDRDFKMCGTWRHGKEPLTLIYDLKKGCDNITISANQSCLSVQGHITGQCEIFEMVEQSLFGEDTAFCVYWEPLLDQLTLEMEQKNQTLCPPSGLYDTCCTGLSHGPNLPKASYGIFDAMIHGDPIGSLTQPAYTFHGEKTSCKELLCAEARQGSNHINIIEDATFRSRVLGYWELPCVQGSVLEMKEDFQGSSVNLPALPDLSIEKNPSIYLPSCLKDPGSSKARVVCSIFTNSSLFNNQLERNNIRILEHVVGITVENEVKNNLPEPVRISFHHDGISVNHSRTCVSWDTRTDISVHWRRDGCETVESSLEVTTCHCNHLTYFTILVELKSRPVRHLLSLTIITYLGCAASMVSCVALLIFLTKQRRAKETSAPVHRGLATSLFCLNLFFFFTGTLANVGGAELCKIVGAALHYSLLASFSWMALEVFHTFWLVYMVFSPSLKTYMWYLIGFGVPAIPVVVLFTMPDIYGVREVIPMDDVSNPYMMCWMVTSDSALMAHYLTNLLFLTLVVLSGLLMLGLVMKKIQNRPEWKKNRVAFLSIWGLSCLFGTTWGLGFLDFGPLSDVVHFSFCILNSFQGFFLMLRFYVLNKMRKQSDCSSRGSSTGSTRQHMLQEKTCS
ncbi:adhesion G-protein coupled receptor G1 [Osmerus eperlanus]|uniref:adhesion G-protein coupled receptor G1 n=1 Tax=Osmerus eperlanus TaxID=29151 RepID=UPI002E1659F7